MAVEQLGESQTAAGNIREETVIDTSQIDLAELPAKEFPACASYRVVISAAAHEMIWKHAAGSVDDARAAAMGIVEVGGILVGNVYKDGDGPYLEITSAVIGEHTDNQGTQMTFTPDTWAQVAEIKDRLFPNEKIVGWYHTHPDFGIFLSDMDKFTHRQFFSPPWTTAFVVDPVQKSEGFFVWSGGETVQTSEYWVGQHRRDSTMAHRMGPVRSTPEKSSPQAPESAVSRATFALSTVVCFLALLVVFGYVYMREVGHSETEKYVMDTMGTQRLALQSSLQELDDLRNELNASRAERNAAAASMDARITHIKLGLLNMQNQTGALVERVNNDELVLGKIVIAPAGMGVQPGTRSQDVEHSDPSGRPTGTGAGGQSMATQGKGKPQ